MKTYIEDIDFMVRTDSRRNRHTALRTYAPTDYGPRVRQRTIVTALQSSLWQKKEDFDTAEKSKITNGFSLFIHNWHFDAQQHSCLQLGEVITLHLNDERSSHALCTCFSSFSRRNRSNSFSNLKFSSEAFLASSLNFLFSPIWRSISRLRMMRYLANSWALLPWSFSSASTYKSMATIIR